ncbi:M13 family metallopeptidase [Lysobacter sp. A6]|uniref:M13 family metallopeptidase n=1 Tax=Noviluteimonas lactosilytica TaxID=2888523 RepID=A0ABS8JLN7_9GAMM|nr:M13 family metallopeptidase [Lysobacter lactosilyticus]MCC8364540.1 M13 family metallopeptidase [Lysobacter lactosilyticus]
MTQKLAPLALTIGLVLVAGLASPDAIAQKKKKSAAKPKAPPAPTVCSDFFSVATADWMKANPQPATGSVTAMGQLTERSLQQQRELLDAAMQGPQGNVQKLLGDFWASGLDEAAVERDGANPVAPLLARIDGIRKAKDIAPSIAALHQVGIPVAFNFGADIDLRDLSRHIGYFSQGGLGMPDPEFYTRGDADTKAVMQRYEEYVQRILVLAGTPADRAAADAKLVVDLETRIAQSSKPIVSLRDIASNFAPVETKDIGKTYKRLQLADFLKAQGVTDDVVSIANPQLFAQLDALAGSLPPAQWQAYLRFHVGNAMAPYLSKSWRDTEFEFRGRVLRGQATPPERWRAVLDAINTAAGPMVGHEYAARFVPAGTKQRAEEIATNVRGALVRAVDRSPWMGATAKTEAKAKLEKLKIEIGTPRRDLDYTVQPMGRGSFGGNMLIASTWRHREEMKRIGRGNADRRWDVLPQQPTLAYDIAQNRLIVTAAMLQAPVLDMSADTATQYGAFGALVGRELTHAVDYKGRLVDAKDTIRDWWTPAENDAWNALGQRMVTQFSQFEDPALKGVKVSGTQTRDTNLADLAGVELAWDAWRSNNAAADATAQKPFFQGWANLWATSSSMQAATERAATSVHSPGKWRVNGPLMNLPAFAEANTCKADSAMVSKDPIRVWP